MFGYLKQSTAVTIKVGPFVDEADGKTAETTLTLSQADFRLSKNGGDFAQKNESSSGTHDEIGYYDVALNTTDTGTLGILTVAVHESGALPVRHDYMVVPANVYDSMVAGSDNLDVNVEDWGNTAVPTTEAGGPGVIRRNTAQGGASSTITLDASASATNDFYNGGTVEIIGATGVGQARTITDYVGSTKVATVDRAWITTPDNTSVFRIFAGSLSSTLEETADAVWDEATSGHSTAGTTGKALTDVLDDTGTSGVVVASIAANAITATAIASDAITAAKIAADAIGASELAADAAAEIADKILGRNLAGASDGGRTVTQALRLLRNKVSISGGTMTVTAEDDSTSSWTAAVTTTAGDPISAIDPA